MPGAAARHSRADSDATVASNSGSLPITRRDQAELNPGDPQGRGSQIWEPAYSAVHPDAASVEQDRPAIPGALGARWLAASRPPCQLRNRSRWSVPIAQLTSPPWLDAPVQ